MICIHDTIPCLLVAAVAFHRAATGKFLKEKYIVNKYIENIKFYI